MITADVLCDIVYEVGLEAGVATRDRLRRVLERVAAGLAEGESAAGSEAEIADRPVFDGLDEDGILARLGLLDGRGFLAVEVHHLRNKLFLTDGSWERKKVRTFPFADESQRLLEHAEAREYHTWADFVIDPACGCGHHAVALPGRLPGACFDVNPRAVLFATINARLNRRDELMVAHNDITRGIPSAVTNGVNGNVLFLVNMPFALAPLPGVLPLSADGGQTGTRLTFAALDAIDRFHDARRNPGITRACVLCYSVGNRDSDIWEVVRRAQALFGAGRIEWKILEGERMWRVNGRKEQSNPMDLGLVPLKAECRLYVGDEDRDATREGYINLVETLQGPPDHWDALGYGILDIHLGD